MMGFVDVILDFLVRINFGLRSTLPRRFREAYWIGCLSRDVSFIRRTESL